jgi:DedD protein
MDYQAPAELPIPAPLPAAAPEQTEDSVAEAPRTVAVPLPPPTAQTAPDKPVKEPPPPPQPPSKPTTKATKQPATPAAGWYVQVGSFGQSDNAGRLRDRLKDAGMDAHLHTADTDKGTSYRVVVGPSATRPQAEKLQQQLATTQKLKGIVIEVGAGQGG